MKAKWCFSVLIAILALFGVSQHQTYTPNQEIVVQFVSSQVTSEEAQNTIANVKFQLELLGADNIQVREESNGVLKISYYSASDVASIKKIVSKKSIAKLDLADQYQGKVPLKLPVNNSTNDYNLDVFEIQKGLDTDLDLEGISIVELKSENPRFFNPNGYASIESIDDKERIVKIAFKLHTFIAIAIDDTSSYEIPEVRAGPFTAGNS